MTEPQSPGQPPPDARRSRRAENRVTGREQRKVAAAEAERRKRLTIAGGTIALVLIVGLVAFLASRPPDLGPPIAVAEAPPASIATGGNTTDGHAMGPEDAPVTLVEWGDYT